MNKVLYLIILILLGIIGYMMLNFPKYERKAFNNQQMTSQVVTKENTTQEYFDVYQYDHFKQSFVTYTAAKQYSEGLHKSYILNGVTGEWMWDNLEDFIVYSQGVFLGDHADIQSAYNHANTYPDSSISYKRNNNVILTLPFKGSGIKDINMAHLFQNPELPRGCEVTALAMLLNYHGIQVDKMTLAKEVKKEPGIYKLDDQSFYGNPEKGFVGDMYTLDHFGFGVFNKPIEELARNYAPKQVINLTGKDFDHILSFVGNGAPVWVVMNTHYQPLEEEYFTTWETEDGPVKVTNKQHAVVITGYDKGRIYFNDPLGIRNNADMKEFEEAWIQMGEQAVTLMPLANRQ